MTGQTIATIEWRALDRDGTDKCRLAKTPGGWMLIGHARFRDASGWAALDYVVRCDADWQTTSCDVTGTQGGGAVALRLTNANGSWSLNDQEQSQISGCTDVDLGFSPATNLMPLRRAPEVGRLDVRAAWLRLPGPMLDPLDQSYTRERGGYVHYTARQTAYEAHLAVDEHGFVTRYPGLWEQTHEA